MDNKWRTVKCPKCGGYGVRMRGDSLPFECGDCNSGVLYIRPSGHTFLWPGGPATGMWSADKYHRDGKRVSRPFDVGNRFGRVALDLLVALGCKIVYFEEPRRSPLCSRPEPDFDIIVPHDIEQPVLMDI